MLLATSVIAHPRSVIHNETVKRESNSEVVLIVKQHQDSDGRVWAVACTSPLNLRMVQCGYDSVCNANGSFVNDDLFCLDICSCDRGRDLINSHHLDGVMAQTESRDILPRSIDPDTTNKTVANSTNSTNTTTPPIPVFHLFKHHEPQNSSTQTNSTLTNSTLTNSTSTNSTLVNSFKMQARLASEM